MAVLTIRQQLYRTLKQRILDGVYPPGAHLNIDIIAKEQGVSNSPLREAMTLLVKDRLVENRPNAGMYVIEITPQLYRELVDTINIWIEGAYRLCLKYGKTECLLALMEERLRALKKVIRRGTDRERIFAILDFQRCFVTATENKVFISSFSSEFDRLCLAYYYNHLGREIDWDINVQRAATIIDAVRSSLVDTVSDMIWTWSVPRFEANQIPEE